MILVSAWREENQQGDRHSKERKNRGTGREKATEGETETERTSRKGDMTHTGREWHRVIEKTEGEEGKEGR